MKRILEKVGMQYKIHKKNNDNYFVEFENETIAIIIMNNKNVFKIDRKWFYEIDDMLLPYIFVLIDKSQNQKYCMKVKEPNNFMRNNFEHTSKNELFFGKEILQNRITDEKLIEELKNIFN